MLFLAPTLLWDMNQPKIALHNNHALMDITETTHLHRVDHAILDRIPTLLRCLPVIHANRVDMHHSALLLFVGFALLVHINQAQTAQRVFFAYPHCLPLLLAELGVSRVQSINDTILLPRPA
jgi:hypothetical protein